MRRLRKILTVLLIAVVVSSTSSVAMADNRTAKDYMAEGIRAAYDNMHLVYQGFYDENGELEEQPGGFVAIEQEWDGEQIVSRTFLDKNCEPINGVCIYWDVKFDEDGWSEWMEPMPDTENYCFTIGYADLGDKAVGDQYRCQVEVEFENVIGIEGKDFWFRTQGAVDGSWAAGNVWDDGLVSLREVPEDSILTYSTISTITENNVSANTYNIGFRCDYWKNGRFRVRCLEIVKE